MPRPALPVWVQGTLKGTALPVQLDNQLRQAGKSLFLHSLKQSWDEEHIRLHFDRFLGWPASPTAPSHASHPAWPSARLPVPARPPVWPQPPMGQPIATCGRHSHPRRPEVAGRRQSPCLLMLARPSKYFHGTSKLIPGSPLGSQAALSSVKPKNVTKPQEPPTLGGADGCSGLNAGLGVSVTIFTGLPGSGKQRSCGGLATGAYV